MRTKLIFTALALAALVGSAFAQTSTTGSIVGSVKDAETGEGIAGVTVVATSATTGTAHSEITDETGAYEITNLAPGLYEVVFYYADITVKRPEVNISLGKRTPIHQKINTNQASGEEIVITDKPPTIDTGSTKQGVSIGQDYTRNLPVPGRTFESTLGAAPGSQGDLYGVSFSGSSSLENNYIVDGVNTTNLNFGTVGTGLVNEFIQETEIITGGYNAEYGRATGGVVNVVTKSGTNEFHGSVFTYFRNSALIAASQRPPTEGQPIMADSNLAYDTDFGFELGGPIVKDKVWFYVGFAPRLVKTNIERFVQRQTDCRIRMPDDTLSACDPDNADGFADRDPDTGFLIYEEIDDTRQNLAANVTSFQFLTKVNFALAPEHQGQITITGTPLTGDIISIYGEPGASRLDYNELTTDLSAKWTSKFNDNKTEVEGIVGWHRVTTAADSIDAEHNDLPLEIAYLGNLQNHALGGRESEAVIRGCTDSGADVDPYPLIDNCPDRGFGYRLGGPGAVLDDKEERISFKVAGSQRVKAAGQHVFKVGIDIEDNRTEVPRRFTGGSFYQNFVNRQINVYKYATINRDSGADVCGYELDDMGMPSIEINCDFVGADGQPVTGQTVNWAGFVQDEWAILPNLNLNLGVRYEEQRLRYSKELQNTVDPNTEEFLGKNAMTLRNMWAPRVGLTYDWTKEGRSKVYAHWGRFYQNIPMRINERSFGGETTYIQVYLPGACGPSQDYIGGPSGSGCPNDPSQAAIDQLFGTGVIVAPGVKPQFLDEWVVGAEYELFEDLRLGVAFQDRRLGRVLEDLSTDGADTYIIANPGEFSEEDEDALEAEIAGLPEGDPERERLEERLEMFRGIRLFDKPSRVYQGLTLTANKRFSRSFYVQASYTYSRTKGNFPGLFSPETGQLDPNITSQYDLIELMANRDGPLAQDQPHSLKFDGYYLWDFGKNGTLLTGLSFRAFSGVPINALGGHALYGVGESYLLPRGSLGRTDFQTFASSRIGYGRELSDGMQLDVFLDIFNFYNNQGQVNVDELYTISDAHPVVGGTYEDLVYAKETNTSGFETQNPITRRGNFGNTSARLSPMSARFGLRLSF